MLGSVFRGVPGISPTHADADPCVCWQPAQRCTIRKNASGQLNVFDCPGHQAKGVETFGGRLHALRIDETKGWLVANNAAIRGGPLYRAAGLGADSKRHHKISNGGAGAAR